MKLTITLPDRIAKRVVRLPNPDDFVSRAVEQALDQETSQTTNPPPGESKWARLAREVEDGSMSLGDAAAKRFSRDRKEFREGFQFKHDREE
ncbi:MAG TPA: hypothetical protein VF789_02300 [Thermoanaerobaculia bacterium]